MKQLTCEMCGSTELVKDGGFFICQTCGTKYSVEEAKKMMIEGTVDVQGTVKVDNSAFVEKYLANARRAKQKEDWEETEKYYNMVEQNDPTNIEAIFYSSYGKAKRSLVDADIYKRQAAFKVLQNCVSIIDDNFDMSKESEQKKIIVDIQNDIFAMAGSSYVYNQTKNQYGVVTWTDKNQTESLFISLIDEFSTTLDNIIRKYPIDERKNCIDLMLMMIKCEDFQILNMGLTKQAKEIRRGRINNLHKRINAIDPSHIVPEYNEPVALPKTSGGTGGVAIILGILGCVFAWLFAIIGHALAIVGICLGVKEYKTNKKMAGLVVSVIAEFMALMSSLIGMAMMM